jgi:hypothetical protein
VEVIDFEHFGFLWAGGASDGLFCVVDGGRWCFFDRWFPRLTRERVCLLNRWVPPLTGGRTFSCVAKKK